MKITKRQLKRIIKEELQNTKIVARQRVVISQQEFLLLKEHRIPISKNVLVD